MTPYIKNVLLAVSFTLFSTACSAESESEAVAKNTEPTAETVEAATSAPTVTDKIIFKTNKGDITIGLYGEAAPLSVGNFLAYTKDGFYNGTIFHRIINGFMIQGGGFDKDFIQKPTKAPIKNEATNGLKNTVGTVAMARTSVVDSATSQFFINVVDNPFLDFRNETPRGYGYAVFGKVLEGMDVVNQIKAVELKPRGMHANAPAEAIEVIAASVLEQ